MRKQWLDYYYSVKCSSCGANPDSICYGNGPIRNGDPHRRYEQGLLARIDALENLDTFVSTGNKEDLKHDIHN